MNASAIETRGLSKSYGDFTAVESLDLDVNEGEIFGFLGPNGAGKSTTIRTMLDQIRASSGTATILGLDSRADALQIRARIGYVPGDLALYPRLTGAETLRYFARLRGGVEQSYVDSLAERLSADLSKKVGSYSTGNRQKIGLIQAFMHRPDLLILDEPNAGLDPLVQKEFHTLLEEVRDEGRTVFLSSHTLSEVERVAGRVAIIRNGELATVETMTEIKSNALRRIEISFAEDVPADLFDGVEGVHDAAVADRQAEISFKGQVNHVLEVAMRHQVADLKTKEADLEEIFLAFYRTDDAGDGRESKPVEPTAATGPGAHRVDADEAGKVTSDVS